MSFDNNNDDFNDDFSDIDRWQGTAKPERSGYVPGPEALPNGSYELEITGAELTKTKLQAKSMFRLNLRVLTGSYAGTELQRVTFFDRQEDYNYLLGDLLTLGIPADQWASRKITAANGLRSAATQLKGIKFKGSKTSSKGKDKDFHNLYIQSKLAGKAASAAPPAQTRPDECVTVGDSSVPF